MEKEIGINKERLAYLEQEVLGIIKEIGGPFLQALSEAYGEKRGWRICGPASVALSRIISARTGIPITRSEQKPRLEVCLGIYDPQEDPDRLQKLEEQTYIRYYSGNGQVYYMDPIYGLLMEGCQDLNEAIQVEKYPVGIIDEALVQRHDLYPFDPSHEGIEKRGWFSQFKTPKERQKAYEDLVSGFNGFRATMPGLLGERSGLLIRTGCGKVVGIIQKFVPSWKEDEQAQEEVVQQILSRLLGVDIGGILAEIGVVQEAERRRFLEGASKISKVSLSFLEKEPKPLFFDLLSIPNRRELTIR